MFVLNKAGATTTADFSSAPFNQTIPRSPAIYEKYSVPPTPYPLLVASLAADFSTYEFIFGNNKGVYYPNVFSSTGFNFSPDYIDPTHLVCGTSSGFASNPTIHWYNLPSGNLAVGPQKLAPDGTLVACPPNVANYAVAQGHGDVLSATVDGNAFPLVLNTGTIIVGNIVSNSWFQAFPLIDLDTSGAQSFITHADPANNLNTTLIEKNTDAAPSYYATRWRQSALGGAATYTQGYIQLSDATDDALFQNAVNFSGNYYYSRGNTKEFFFTVVANTGFPVCCFALSTDLTSYRRIDITPGLFKDSLYFEDIDGFKYLIGTLTDGRQGYAAANVAPTIHETILQPQVFSLGCWSPCANHIFHFLNEAQENG